MASNATPFEVDPKGLCFEGEITPMPEAAPVETPAVDPAQAPEGEPATTPALPPIPFRCVARTGKPAPHGWWSSPTVQDFAGMSHAERIAVNFGHNDTEIVGYADQFDTSSGDLVLTGALTPTTPDDRASQLKQQWDAGVPFQASIEVSEDGLVIEEIPAGVQAVVNGLTVDGPVTIFRAWKLRGVAVCQNGADDGTSFQFSAKNAKAMASMFRRVAPAAPPATKTGPEFIAAFGQQGAVWFAEGKSWDEARDLHAKAAGDRAANFEAEVKRLTAVVAGMKGGQPVTFTPEPADKPKPPERGSHLPDGLAKFAAHNRALMSRTN
jgi:hypothetical protein